MRYIRKASRIYAGQNNVEAIGCYPKVSISTILKERLTRNGSLNEVFGRLAISIGRCWGILLPGAALDVSSGQFATYMYARNSSAKSNLVGRIFNGRRISGAPNLTSAEMFRVLNEGGILSR